MRFDEITSVIEQFHRIGGKYLVLSGGEPFTFDRVYEILEFACALNLKVGIETNGLVINKPRLQPLYKYSKNLRFLFSLDGFSPESNDWFRQKEGAFTNTKRQINWLTERGFLVSVSTVMNNRNLHEVEDMINHFVFEKKMHYRIVPYISMFGRGAESLARAAALDNATIIDFLYNKFYPLYLSAKKADLDHFMFFDIPKAILPEDMDMLSQCGWAHTMAGINPNGEFGICHRTVPGTFFSIRNESCEAGINMGHLWSTHSLSQDLRTVNADTLTGVCSNCKYNFECRGHCRLAAYNSYNSIYAPYPVCQALYEEGLFPVRSLVNQQLDCRYKVSMPLQQ